MHGTKVLQVLSLRGGNATQAELAAEVGLGQERLSPILAGLHHNGYVARSFAPDRITVTLTDEGLRWLAKSTGAAPPPQSARPLPQQRQQPQPAPQSPPPAPPQSQAPQTSDVRRRLGLGKPAATAPQPKEPASQAPAVAAPAPAPAPAPVVEEPTPAETASPAAEEPASGERRSRRRKPKAKEEIATDESGFVTHIKGKAIF